MAKKSLIIKAARPAKYSTRKYNRCQVCGRPRGYGHQAMMTALKGYF